MLLGGAIDTPAPQSGGWPDCKGSVAVSKVEIEEHEEDVALVVVPFVLQK